MMENTTRTFLCGDLFTQGGIGEQPLVETDILGPSEAFRAPSLLRTLPAIPVNPRALAGERPQTLACMHGSAWRGDGPNYCAPSRNRLSAPNRAAAA